jgi:anhydro-N-acetylmuramic acid kinase
MTLMRAIGLMSGTSIDGVDVALIDTDGERVVRQGPSSFAPYDDADRALLRRALADALPMTDRTARPGALAAAQDMITQRHAAAVEDFLAAHDLAREAIDIIGFHGQTVLHRPEQRLTVQIGDADALAKRLGVRVAHDFRAADVASGGQGAPLVPAYHRALVEAAGLKGAIGVLNIGGVANISFCVGDADPLACDTGPGNALIDDLMLARTGVAMDRDGAAAARGTVNAAALALLIAHPFFQQMPPKSLDRNAFSLAPVEALSTEDAAATLAAFTAEAVARLRGLPSALSHIIVCGGGAKNPVIMRELAARTGAAVTSADQHGWSADAMEAQAFAYLAVRTQMGLPLTFPSTTGVSEARRGGVIAG